MRCRHSTRRCDCQPNESNLGSPLREICSAGSARGDGHKRPNRKTRPYPPPLAPTKCPQAVSARRVPGGIARLSPPVESFLEAPERLDHGKYRVGLDLGDSIKLVPRETTAHRECGWKDGGSGDWAREILAPRNCEPTPLTPTGPLMELWLFKSSYPPGRLMRITLGSLRRLRLPPSPHSGFRR